MKAWVWALAAGLVLGAAAGAARAEVYDIATYAAPAGWARQDTATSRTFTAVDRQAGTFCRLVLFTATASTGDARRDFDTDWQGLVATPYKTEPVRPQAERGAGGWQLVSGSAPFVWDGRRAEAALLVYSDGSRRFTVSALGTADCTPALSALRASLVLAAPASVAAPAARPAPAPAASAEGGWTLAAVADFVEARRGAVTVRLHHAAPIPDALRADAEAKRRHFWDTLVLPRLADVRNVLVSRIEPYVAVSDWIAADATDRASGSPVRVVLHLFTAQGVVRGVEVVAPNATELAAVGATGEQAAALRELNRFPVQPADLPGRWSDSGSTFAQYVNAYTGANAGTAVQGSAYTLVFDASGRYTSEFKSVSGFVGSLRFGQENRAGTWRLQGGQLETQADDGKRRSFRAWFEAVRGGRVLHLQDTQYAAMHDVLARR